MALTVETGAGLPNADSFIDLAYADAYHLALGNVTWTGTDDLKEQAIRRATALLSSTNEWAGYRTKGRDQALAWPRVDIIDSEGFGIPSTTIPVEVKKATAEVALRELVSPGSMAPDFIAADTVKREKVGEIEVEYSTNGATAAGNRPVIAIVSDLLSPFLRRSASVGLFGRAVRG